MSVNQALNPALWWKQAVVYQVYPRSFKDSTGNGIGDLRGVVEKIPYLHELGVDAIWLNPFYPSHMADAGYDVDDYRDVDPLFGTMDDFSDLTKSAHAAGIKVIVDIVPNHTSNQHKWFKEALASKPGSAARDRYIFRDGKGPNGDIPPSNWESHFGDPAWTRVPDGQWYLHMFARQQPDLNWKNPEVHEDFKKTFRFWLDHGVDGFRIDVAQGLAKDLDRDDLDNYHVWCDSTLPDDGSHPVIDRNESHEIFKEWRREVFNTYDPPTFAVGEAMVNPKRLHLYASPDELGQTFNFEFAKKNWVRDEFHEAIESGLAQAREAGSSATWVMSNHDLIRHASRYALPQVHAVEHHQIATDWLLRSGHSYIEDREVGTRRARAAILMELALPGSAYIYQGEELGLFEVADIPWDKLEDPWGHNSTHDNAKKGRDGCRVPIPWDSNDAPKLDHDDDEFGHGGSFGFSPKQKADGSPSDGTHLPQPKWFKEHAVDVEERDSGSMLNLYRDALRIRHELRNEDTDVEWLKEDRSSTSPDGANGNPGGVIAYKRSNGWANLTNFGSESVVLPKGEVLLCSGELDDEGRLPRDTSVWMKLR